MAKTSVDQWDTTPANNTDLNSIALGEGQTLPSNVNNLFREMMAQVKTKFDATSSISTASTTEALTGTNSAKAVTPDSLAALWEKGSDTASAGTVSLGEGGLFHVTGTTTITDIDFSTAKDGRAVWVVFDGILTLTHNSTTLTLPGGANITTAAGDRALFIQDNGDNIICLEYVRAGFHLSSLALAQGDIPYANGANSLTKLAKGTAGQHLVMNSGATAPEWVDASGGMTLLETIATTSGNTLTSTASFSGYRELHLEFEGISTSGNAPCIIYISHDGTNFSAGGMDINPNSAPGSTTNGVIKLMGIQLTTADKRAFGWASHPDTVFSGYKISQTANGALTHIRLNSGISNFDAGTFRIYGVK